MRDTRRIEPDEEMFETIMLGLRKCSGISRAEFQKRFGADMAVLYAPAIAELELDGMIEVTEDSIYLNNRGLDFQNEALLKFMEQ